MYAELYSYLILHKSLPVPGIGTFLLQRQPAVADFPNKKIVPPSYLIELDNKENAASKHFFKWLGIALSSTDHDAVIRFNDFAFNMKQQVAAGAVTNWQDVGTISKGLGGDIKFVQYENSIPEQPVVAEKVIREKAEHMVRVGEDEKTSDEMSAFLNQAEERRSYWWTAALVIGLLSVMFLGWYFSENGVEISSAANSKKTTPIEPSSTYKIMP